MTGICMSDQSKNEHGARKLAALKTPHFLRGRWGFFFGNTKKNWWRERVVLFGGGATSRCPLRCACDTLLCTCSINHETDRPVSNFHHLVPAANPLGTTHSRLVASLPMIWDSFLQQGSLQSSRMADQARGSAHPLPKCTRQPSGCSVSSRVPWRRHEGFLQLLYVRLNGEMRRTVGRNVRCFSGTREGREGDQGSSHLHRRNVFC